MVITNSETKDVFTKEGIEAIVLDEGSYQSKDFTIRAVPANHEKILAPTLPQNTAYIINDSFLNPGDSFASLPSTFRGIKALALVVAAPWTTEVTTAEFAETIAPQMVIPVHDGYVKGSSRRCAMTTTIAILPRWASSFNAWSALATELR